MSAAVFRSRLLLVILVTSITFTVEAQPHTARAEKHNPVILVHGFKDTSSKMQKMARLLRKQGRIVFTPTLSPSWGEAGIEELAQQLSNFVAANLKRGTRFDLVGFSMGGIVCRYYLQRLGGIERVDHFVAISVPEHGTLFANLCPNFLHRPGIRQLRCNSPLLRGLNRDSEMLERLQFTTIWTPLDLMIFPSWSSRMRVGREITLWMPLHPLMVWHPAAIRAVVEALK